MSSEAEEFTGIDCDSCRKQIEREIKSIFPYIDEKYCTDELCEESIDTDDCRRDECGYFKWQAVWKERR